MDTVDKLDVYFGGALVGTMAPYMKYRTAFEYSEEWLQNGFSLSPFSLPLTPGVRISKADPFNGLFGIFADSLPDGWGRLLVDRMLRKEGEDPATSDPLQRLAIVGSSGMGGLEYKPSFQIASAAGESDLDRLAEECRKILVSEESTDLETLFALGGSSGGARPKVMVRIDGEEWIVKFPSSSDPDDIGIMEYDYAACAKECGIEIPETRLFPSVRYGGFFGAKRFDRLSGDHKEQKIHMASASALLEISHRVPALDYNSLISLTWQLTKSAAELDQMYRRMCFNVFAHNRDDHSNNFSFLRINDRWHLSPAYDLTHSDSLGGEHATTVNGEGKDPGMADILAVARRAGVKEQKARRIAEQIRETVAARLSEYLK